MCCTILIMYSFLFGTVTVKEKKIESPFAEKYFKGNNKTNKLFTGSDDFQ